jgi:hypothetical protein
MRKLTTGDRGKKPLAHAARIGRVRRMVDRVEAKRSHFESIGHRLLAEEKAQEKRYWQFVLAVLELKPSMSRATYRHTIH